MAARSSSGSALGRWLADVDGLLRHEGVWQLAAPLPRLALTLCAAGMTYGLVMGSWAADPLAACYSALKVPLLLLGAGLVCLPSFVIATSVLGLRDDLAQALRAVAAGQAVLAVVLASLAPVTAFLYLTTDDYPLAKLGNGVCFGVAALAAHGAVRRRYRPLIARNPRHRVALRVWPLLHVFVALQLAWALRPFVGHPAFPVEFMRADWWGNVYLDLWWALRALVGV